MAKKNKNPIMAMEQLESFIKDKTTETYNNQRFDENKVEKGKVVTNAEKPKAIKEDDKKNFQDFFKKNYTTKDKDSELISINIELKAVLLKLVHLNKTTQVALTSNIVNNWIQTYRGEIEKSIKKGSKLKLDF